MSASPVLKAADFFDSLYDADSGLWRFAAGGGPSLYGTVFALMTYHYLGRKRTLEAKAIAAIQAMQDPESGYFLGPDIDSLQVGGKQDRLHLMQHLTCHVLPACDLYGIAIKPITAAREFVDLDKLNAWLDARNWKEAWLEGNNLLFVGQLLAHLRDVELFPGADKALERWFEWHDEQMDPKTGLWGTNGYCDAFEAMCGGYHQLLLYYWSGRPLRFDRALIDTTLSLQHPDGGFAPGGGGGACEDVDAIDILVNAYKRTDYRRPDVRAAARMTLESILRIQNTDGGFPYSQDAPWMYMGMANTKATPSQSHAFGAWFRIHTIALIAEILDDSAVNGLQFEFNTAPSMGWHLKWNLDEKRAANSGSEEPYRKSMAVRALKLKLRRILGAMKRRLLRR